MSVELHNKKISVKPGFGRKLETPTFNKTKTSSAGGADSSVFSNTTTLNRTSLKDSASQSISTSTLNKSLSTSYTSSSSSVFKSRSANFVPGNHFLGVSDYVRDRNDVRTGITTGIGYDASVGGYRSGKHDLELFTGGLTQASERRMMQRAGMVDLSKLGQINFGGSNNSGSSGKTSWLAKLGIGLGIGKANEERGWANEFLNNFEGMQIRLQQQRVGTIDIQAGKQHLFGIRFDKSRHDGYFDGEFVGKQAINATKAFNLVDKTTGEDYDTYYLYVGTEGKTIRWMLKSTTSLFIIPMKRLKFMIRRYCLRLRRVKFPQQ